MRTEFSKRQLSDPDTREIESILRKCVHCGFCNATCPTFQLSGDELDSPRGRIYLMKDMFEDDSVPGKEVVKHLDRCLSCLSCMSTCPSGVDYMHLVDHARSYVEKNYRRGWLADFQRTMLTKFLPSPGKFRSLIKLAKLVLPLHNLLPSALVLPLKLTATVNINPGRLNNLYPADNKKTGSIALLPGCAQQVVGDEINQATIRLLNRFGFDVHILNEIECCAAIEHHLGKTSLAETRIRANLEKIASMLPNLDAIISNASGCGTMMKDYDHLMQTSDEVREAAFLVSQKTMDICEFLWQQELSIDTATLENLKVAYQSPCSMQHAQKVSQQPVDLLKRFGFDVSDLPESYLCCGSAGTYNILQAEIAEKLGRRKIDNIESVKADIVASGNLACMMQLRQYSGLPFVHTVELLDWASGGPEPTALKTTW